MGHPLPPDAPSRDLVVGPEYYADRPPAEVGVEPVMGDGCLDRGDADGELVKGHLDVSRRALLWASGRSSGSRVARKNQQSRSTLWVTMLIDGDWNMSQTPSESLTWLLSQRAH